MNATNLFREAVAAIPKDVTTQVNWSFAIADKIDAKLKEIGMKEVGKTEPEVSRWLSGTHNFTLRTLAKISSVLGEDIIKI